jgi:hypothetical protein
MTRIGNGRGQLPICHWGCAICSCVDCSQPTSDMVVFDPYTYRSARSETFFCAKLQIDEWRSPAVSSPHRPVIRPTLSTTIWRLAQRCVAFAKRPEASQYFSTTNSARITEHRDANHSSSQYGGARILMLIAQGNDKSLRSADCVRTADSDAFSLDWRLSPKLAVRTGEELDAFLEKRHAGEYSTNATS